MPVCAKCRLNKEASEFSIDRSRKSGLQPYCCACRSADYHRNSELNRLNMKKRYEANRELRKKTMREYYSQNRAALVAQKKAWYAENREYAKAKHRECYAKDKAPYVARAKARDAANPAGRRARDVSRKARKLHATPSWANHFFISEAYSLAKLREACCGGKWEVDHIVPLQSKRVCGLHAETNLRVILSTANRAKSNLRWPDMPL